MSLPMAWLDSTISLLCIWNLGKTPINLLKVCAGTKKDIRIKGQMDT